MLSLDFACYMSTAADKTGIQQMEFENDSEKKTVTLKPKQGDKISMKNVQWFNFGTTGTDFSLCSDNGSQYQWKDAASVDLSGVKASAILSHPMPDIYPDLNVTMSYLESGALNVHWTYDN